MQPMVTRAEVNTICLWMYATPVLFSWALLSWLPFFGLFIEGASALSLAGDAAFFATSFVALAAVFATLSFSAKPQHKDEVNQLLRGKVGLLSAYATLWLVGYWAFKHFVV